MLYTELVEYRGIKYSIEKNKATVVGAIDSIGGDIKIPEIIFSSIPVVGVADKAFFKRADIENVSLPATVEFIGKNAFAWCPSLKSIKMHGVKIIKERAFMGDGKLSVVDFSDKLTEICDKAFAYCNSLVSMELPESLEYLGGAIFEGCRYLKYVSIPENINMIKNGTFYACTSLCDVRLPSELKYIDEYAFAYCVALNNIELGNTTIINRDAFYECGKYNTKTLVS